MSLHRVLPLPVALSDSRHSQQWDVGPDALEGARIMTERTTSTAPLHSPRVSASLPQTSSSPADPRQSISPQDSSEDYQSPTVTRPALNPRKRGDIPWEQAEPLQEEEYTASICLCQPDPKVPRPRNAFILYRQHFQASVVAQNPGLANPQISKVIGDRWRTEPEEEKNRWKLLAEGEKARHQRQYPGYRYQPRKSNRTNSVSSTLPVTDEANLSQTRCNKCGGRSINSAAMMSVTATGSQQNNHGHRTSSAISFSPSRAHATPGASSANSRFVRGLGSPPSAQLPPQGYRYLPHQPKNFPLTSPHSKRPDLHEPPQRSPDAKRRRMVNSVAFAPLHGPTGPSSPLPFPVQHRRRESLPRLESLGPSSLYSPFTMGPPPRQQPLNRSENGLTLAPLQQASAITASNAADTQAKSLEAMILSIPTLNKIKVLARISAPLAASPPSTPTAPLTGTSSSASTSAAAAASRDQTGKRGLVIAIDAADPLALKQLTKALAHALAEHDVKIMPTPRLAKNTEPSFQSYLRLIDEYHTLSAQIKEHITITTTTTASASTAFTSSSPSPHHSHHKHLHDLPQGSRPSPSDPAESPLSPKSFPKETPPKANPSSDESDDDEASSSSPAATANSLNNDNSASKKNNNNNNNNRSSPSPSPSSPISPITPSTKLPIALLPSYQLTHTDHFATTTEILDRYSPLDHWQWGATVWRGVVGPDLTVAVTPFLPSPNGGPGEDSPVKTGDSISGKGKEGGNGGQGVDVRIEDARAVIVKGEDGRDGVGGVADGAVRRVGFEVGEWVRGWRGGGRG